MIIKHATGFTLLELMIALGILAVFVAISVPIYQDYIRDAEVAEISLEYSSWGEQVKSRLPDQQISQCSDLLADTKDGMIAERSARLSMGFQAVNAGPQAGYRPVFQVCARADMHQSTGIGVATAAHEKFSTTGSVEPGAVVSESVVSFSLPLTSDDDPVCRVPAGIPLTPCGQPVATPTINVSQAVQPPVTPAPQNVVVPTAQTVTAPALLAPMDETVDTDFSDPPVPPGLSHQFVDPTLWGWKTDNPDGKVEHGIGSAYGDTSGQNLGIIELEGLANTPSNLFREIATQPGARYTFSFDLSGRVGVSSQSAGVEIIWDGKVVDTIYPPANVFGFQPHNFDLVATSTSSRIELRAVTQDGGGPVVDNLKMQYTGGGRP